MFECVLGKNEVDGSIVGMKRNGRLKLLGGLVLEALAPVNDSQLSLRHPERRVQFERPPQCFNGLLGLAHQNERNSLPVRALWALWSELRQDSKLLQRLRIAL